MHSRFLSTCLFISKCREKERANKNKKIIKYKLTKMYIKDRQLQFELCTVRYGQLNYSYHSCFNYILTLGVNNYHRVIDTHVPSVINVLDVQKLH